MSHYYAKIPVSARKTAATARGHTSTGIETIAASWNGSISVRLWYDEENNVDRFEINQDYWHGQGVKETIATGVIGQCSRGS